MAKKVDHEERFYVALKRITAYMTPAQLRRASEREYGLDHAEALEMAYENVIEEARSVLRGYRRPKIQRANVSEATRNSSVVAEGVTAGETAPPEAQP